MKDFSKGLDKDENPESIKRDYISCGNVRLLDRLYILVDRIPEKAKSWEEYCLFMEKNDNVIVAKTQAGEIEVSTIFLGVDHSSYYQNSTPILFETMIFGWNDDSYKERYSTWSEAEVGHKRAVELIESKK